jgi:hypothetical protein
MSWYRTSVQGDNAGRVELAGLRHHQLSILRYFGVADVPDA